MGIFENSERIIILDGAMGTQLVERKAPMGKVPEALNITHPEIVKDVHRAYVNSGSDVIYTNTFSANAYKLQDCEYSVSDIVKAGVRNAKEVVQGTNAKVAMSMGTIGDILEPLGNMKFEEAYEIYKEMVVAGEEAGADILVFETQTDLLEVKAGVLAAKENTKLPVWVTMTFEKNGRTFTGTVAESMAITLTALGVDALGVNCSLGPAELLPLVKKIRQFTHLPLMVKPNAGLPNPMTNQYDMTPDQFADAMVPYLEMGIDMVGGCCGTSPEYIDRLAKRATQFKRVKRENSHESYLCSNRDYVVVRDVHVVGERINPTGKKIFKEALLNHDIDYIKAQAIEQTEAGATILDVNVGLPKIDEKAMMTEVVRELQSIVDAPLQIDSSNPEVIEAALRIYNGKALVNSVNGEERVLETILPIAAKYGAAIIGLTMDENGIPSLAEERFAIAERIVNKAAEYSIGKEDIYIDCLTLAASVQQKEVQETLKAIRRVRKELGVKTVLGVSNISFGLPKREYINTTFLAAALEAGLNLPIINPNTAAMMGTVDAYRVLFNLDEKCTDYVDKYAMLEEKSKSAGNGNAVNISGQGNIGGTSGGGNGTESSVNITSSIQSNDTRNAVNITNISIGESIRKGFKDTTAGLVREMLVNTPALDIVNYSLIPALDEVGKAFEKGTLFLPQLLGAASAAESGFDVIKKYLAETNSGVQISKGKIVLATVKGDVHDIGKNIVKTILENYGYTVIDLGKDVPVEKVVSAAIENQVKLVGLSALMTTTVASMEETIKALRASGHDCKIMVGGAVLTEDFALQIGADYYARDAKRSADIAHEVLGN